MWSSRRTLTPLAGKRWAWFLSAGLSAGRRPVPLGLVVDLHRVAVAGEECIGGPVAQVALGPALAVAGLVDHAGTMLQRLGAGGAVGEVAEACGLGFGELQRVVLVVVPGAQVDRLALPAALGEAEDLGEEAQALLGLGGQQLDMGKVRQIEGAESGLHGLETSVAMRGGLNRSTGAWRRERHRLRGASCASALCGRAARQPRSRRACRPIRGAGAWRRMLYPAAGPVAMGRPLPSAPHSTQEPS